MNEVLTNLPYPRYIVQDEDGEILKCVLNENEIVKFNPSEVYQIEKVLKKRKRGKKLQYYVKWLHLDKKFNSWIDENQFVTLNK